MGVVAPISAVGAAIVPVLAGAVMGERLAPVVWLGIVAAMPGIWLVSSAPDDPISPGEPRESIAAGAVDGVLAGLGFGMLFAALGQIPASSGLWPLAVCQAVSVPAVVLLAVALRAAWVPRDRAAGLAVLVGPMGALATGLFLLATQHGFLTIAGVLTALYPASTVLLAAVLLHERVHRAQGIGLGLCAAAVVLVATG
jgi:drug/metabolite transporter (DMT)-like permease